MILDPKDGTPIKEEELDKSAVKLEPGATPPTASKKGLFPCETCGKVSSIEIHPKRQHSKKLYAN